MTSRLAPLARVPVLTEVIDFPQSAPEAEPAASSADVAVNPAANPDVDSHIDPIGVSSPAQAFDINETQLTQRILADVQRQVDLMVEFRLREALMPALARATEALVKDARGELAATLKDVVTRAVSQEMSKHRVR